MNPTEQEKYLINLRREKLQNLLACGVSQSKASQVLNVSEATIHSDVIFLRQHARDYVRRYNEHFAEEYKRCLDFLSQIMLEAWTSASNIKYERNKASLLSIAKDCVIAKAALLSDINLIDRTVTYVEGLKKKHKRLLEDGNVEDRMSPSEDGEDDEKIEVIGEAEDDGGHAF